MKSSIGKAALAAMFALGAGTASAGVVVNYVNPERFVDLPGGDWEREQVLRELGKYFEKLGKDLPAGQDLTLDILDIDLAGTEAQGQRAGGDIRIRQGINDWPYIELRYTVSANGQVLNTGTAQLKDAGYLSRPTKLSMENDSLRYEKRMIESWFKKTILQK